MFVKGLAPSVKAIFLCLVLLAGGAAPRADAEAAGAVVVGGALSEGLKLYRENKPEAAVPLLEQAVKDPAVDERAWLWLAVCYQQLGRLDAGIAVLRKGIAGPTVDKAPLYYNLGNLFLLQGKASFAREMFDSSIAADASFAPAWLNRANAALQLSDLRAASDDYTHYLDLDPGSPQKASIETLLARLSGAISADDQKKAALEAAKAAEDLARKSLLDEVTSSLKAAAEETTNLAAGSGQVQGYGDELAPSD
jgi:tetratricopeptide (TPR) repeat protein